MFDEIVAWMMDTFKKEDLELATNEVIPGLLANSVEVKKAAEVANALALTHGARMKGPKRMKMTTILIGCIVARKTRENGSP